jgi:hypothetical protein
VIYVHNVEEVMHYVYDVAEATAQMLGKPVGYFDFLSFGRPMARSQYES